MGKEIFESILVLIGIFFIISALELTQLPTSIVVVVSKGTAVASIFATRFLTGPGSLMLVYSFFPALLGMVSVPAMIGGIICSLPFYARLKTARWI